MASTLVIGEPGGTADGEYDTYVRLIETAAAAGCDVFKPQWVSDVFEMCQRRHIGPYHAQYTYYFRAYQRLNFPVAWHADFQRLCHARGLQYACTAFLPQDVATLEPFVDYHKVSSFEAADPALLDACQASHRPTIVSTGMSDGPDVTALYGRRAASGSAWQVLACTSAYPAPLDQMNIYAIAAERLDGLSDHSRSLVAGAVAVACGAAVVETHFRLDDCDPANPDYPVAFTPAEFAQYIQYIRDAERMLGDGVKQVQACERALLPFKVTA